MWVGSVARQARRPERRPIACAKWNAFTNSGMVQDMEKGFNSIGQQLGQGNTSLYMLQSLI